MITKYKISELAKDFDIKPNAVIDVIQAAFGVKKARTAILEEDELNMIFEKFTLEHNVESLDAYFELKSPEGEKPAEPKTKAKAKEKAEEKA
ncbi:MAG: translation initiation factor IF-2 N-terminal domain-containing protein, partial [Clostridia bacterium]|nr:translation initiation factor IF-2 N-terminal domain-containing protein [Clostridia bacterium]